MTANGVSGQPLQVNRGLLVGGVVLLGVGGVLGAAGVLLGSLAVVSATRQWVNQLDTPPSEMALQALHQARAATSAAAEAWRGQGNSKKIPA